MIEGQEGVSWPQWRALAEACERHGIGTMFRSDHYMNLDGCNPQHAALDAWATISALAACTTSVRLGTLVSPASFRHPSVLAKQVATADQISGGRIEVGLGAGWHEREHAAYGFSFAPVSERIDVLEEQLEIVLSSWADEPFSFDGRHYQLDQLNAQPKPVQRPHPPLIMGGNAGPRSAEIAARYADEYNTPFAAIDDVRARKARIDDACERDGREPLPFSVMTGVVIGADQNELRARTRRLAQAVGSEELPAAWISGTPEEAAEKLIALHDAGVSRVMCQHLLHDDLEAVALLGDEVVPRVK